MDFLHEEPDDLEVGCTPTVTGTETITLDITYDDSGLRALFSVASSNWASENLTDSLKQGRVTNDLWALGFPTPDAVTSVYIRDDQYLCVQVVVTCDELVDLSSLLNPANKYRQQLRIRNISIVNRKKATEVPEQQSLRDELCTVSTVTASSDETMGISPITTVSDYFRRFYLGASPPLHFTVMHPFNTPRTLQEPRETQSEPIAEPTCVAGTSRHGFFVELEKKLFSTELELGLQTRRLRDAHRELQERQAEVDKLASQLRAQELELKSTKVQLNAQLNDAAVSLARSVDYVPENGDSYESRIEDPEDRMATDVGHVAEQADWNESRHAPAVLEAPACARVVCTPEPQSCARCQLRNQSAKLSELLLRAMELRVTMFESRQTETESHAVQLLDALQLERRMRLQIEAELVIERQKRRGVEEMVEAIAKEAKWPLVMPNMLDVFLKFQGMNKEVSREGKEG